MSRVAPVQLLTVLAMAAAVSAAGSAMAQDQQTVTVTGDAEKVCTLGQPTQADGALVNFDTPSGSVFAVTRLADPDSLSTRAANMTLGMPAMCNGVHRVAIASDNNGLWRQGAGAQPAGFGSAVPYKANLVWADQQYRMNADASTRGFVQEQVIIGRPATGDLLIEFAIDAGATNAGSGAPLVAGDYSDVLRVTVEPQ
ncbi:hypothetical protein [Brevundimonas lenta]|uniref:Spore coat protein U domain-containing protein n=1 Tax=Brevundimonas lenta TaxID=424796 RepID=A0A7W6NPM6_9CAUL|nr:hypothetical protein [Brevundimonas lenta]MBB4082325.1 hypothetical protein [Brevundimonas lenta]